MSQDKSMVNRLLNVSIVLYKYCAEEVQAVVDELKKSDCINKIYLVDNSSVFNNQYEEDRVEYIFSGKNGGYGAGHNIAIKKSFDDKVKYHLVMNYDIKFDYSILGKLVEKMDQDSTIGLIMPKVLNSDGSCQLLPKIMPTPIDLLIRVFSPLHQPFMKRNERYTLKRYMDYEINISNSSGCFSFLRTEALQKAGVYDESFFMYFEDNDLTRRILKYYRTVYYPGVSIVHSHGRGATNSLRLLGVFIKSAANYFFKYGWFFDKGRKKANQFVLNNLPDLGANNEVVVGKEKRAV